MLYCPLLPYAGPVATARGIPAVVLKPAELQKTSRTKAARRFVPGTFTGDKVSYEIGHDAQVSWTHRARAKFYGLRFPLRSTTREANFVEDAEPFRTTLNHWVYRLSSKSTFTSRQFYKTFEEFGFLFFCLLEKKKDFCLPYKYLTRFHNRIRQFSK